MNDKACETCRYWVRLHDGNVGDCRKHAPRFIQNDEPYNMRIWPNTYDMDWCDEHKRIKEKKEKGEPYISGDPHEHE